MSKDQSNQWILHSYKCKAAFTLIYILIVNILSPNKIIYKLPHLYIKIQIHKQSLVNKVIYKWPHLHIKT